MVGVEYQISLYKVTGKLFNGAAISGYEIHAGITTGHDLAKPAVTLDNGHNDGVISTDQQIFGCYLHGLFDHPEACEALLQWAGVNEVERVDYDARREYDIDRIAASVDEHLDMALIIDTIGFQHE